MISKTTSLFSPNKLLLVFMLLVLPSTLYLFAQTITPQKLDFTKICAGDGFNEFHASFTVSGFPAGTTFVVELSDPLGSFATPTATIALPSLVDTATDKTLTFAVPSTLIGSNTYNLRIKGTTGAGVVSYSANFKSYDLKNPFPAYFKAYNGPFLINNNTSTVSFCNGSSVTITVYNPTPQILESSPANYPQLKYNWYKNNVLIPGQTGSSLSVNSVGEYYAELDYGFCTEVNNSSQRVTVSGSSGSTATIDSSFGNPFCSSTGNTTLTATVGNSYIWKKDNAVIVGVAAQTYQTNLPGYYTCDVDFGGCTSTGSIDLKVNELASSISGVEVDTVNFIQQGESLNVTTTTSATVPTYQWFLNDIAISSAAQSTLNVTEAGKYKVIIRETSGCQVSDEFLFEVSYKVDYNVAKIPNIVTPNNDTINDTWIIPDEYTGGKAQVMILSSLGEMVFQTDNYDNYNGWPQTPIEFNNFNPVYYYIITPSGQSAKKGSITLVK